MAIQYLYQLLLRLNLYNVHFEYVVCLKQEIYMRPLCDYFGAGVEARDG